MLQRLNDCAATARCAHRYFAGPKSQTRRQSRAPIRASGIRENHCDCVVSSLKRDWPARSPTAHGRSAAAKREAFVNKFLRAVGAAAIASLLAVPAGAAEIKVG